MAVSQEVMALGMCTFISSFIGSLPVTGSFSDSSINSASGVQTPFGGCVTSLIVLSGKKICS